jgi:hypothetical protein
MQRHTCFRCALHQQDDVDLLNNNKKKKKASTHNIDVIPCTRDREVFAIVGETQV